MSKRHRFKKYTNWNERYRCKSTRLWVKTSIYYVLVERADGLYAVGNCKTRYMMRWGQISRAEKLLKHITPYDRMMLHGHVKGDENNDNRS